MELAMKPADIVALVSGTVESFTIYARRKGIEISEAYQPQEIPELMIDVIRVRQVLHDCPCIPKRLLFAHAQFDGGMWWPGSLRSTRIVHAGIAISQRYMAQVLFNLLGNAVKFTTSGGIAVNVTYADKKLTIAVADTGPGMSPDQLARLFQPYSQVWRL
jgi:signal transduction histidine kinase